MDIDDANRVSMRQLVMDAYEACAKTAEALDAENVANEIRKLAFMVKGESAGLGKTMWTLPNLAKKGSK